MEVPEEKINQNPSPFLSKLAAFTQTKRTIAFLIVLILVFISSIFLFLNKSATKNQPEDNKAVQKKSSTPKTWEIILSFDQKNQKLSLKNLSLINKRILPDKRTAQFSPYEVSLLGSKDEVLFKTKVNISEQILYDLLKTDGQEIKAINVLESVVYIPFNPSAAKIIIAKNSQPVLEIKLPENISYNPKNVLGDTTLSCGPMTVVFISDNYKYEELNKYDADVASIISAFNSVEPYNSVSSIFDFQIIKNETSLGCNLGLENCFNQKQVKIKQTALDKFPRASKFIVLVNNPNGRAVDGDILGGTNGPGGDVVIFTTNRMDISSEFFKKVAIHEFLGHAVGVLLDRYVYPLDHPYSNLTSISPEPNCANSGNIPALWKNAGISETFPGCTSKYLFAPFKRDCPGNNGNSKSVMSTATCSQSSNFDTIEKNWIQTQVIPMYPACPTPIETETPTPSPSPTSVSNLPSQSTDPMACKVEPQENVRTTSCTFYNGNDDIVPGKEITRWCRTGTWKCTDTPPYTVDSWCKANQKCSFEFPPVDGPSECLECSESDAPLVNDTEANNGYYCINFEGDCSGNSCSDCSDTSKYEVISHIIKSNQSSGCHDCSSGGGIPESAEPETSGSQTSQVQYNCVEDPKCKGQDEKSMQLCQLICSPK